MPVQGDHGFEFVPLLHAHGRLADTEAAAAEAEGRMGGTVGYPE
jgi:hypothetical protein